MQGSRGDRVYTSADELRTSPPPDWLAPHARAAAQSRRFILVWRDPLILVYLGERADYVVVGGHYCSCEGFIRRTSRNGIGGCSHVFGARIALEEGLYRTPPKRLEAGDVARIVWEAATGGRAITLRRLLAEDVGDDDYDSVDGCRQD